MKAETISLASSHASMVSHPEEIAAFIIKAAKKLGGDKSGKISKE
ncbi:hypothetical protein ABIE26_000050 [Pedobacter africanus]|uniref:Uncharacterized protein n=1 Tax=Pedobacter africanus TaxID=151894 RepID=A0ACC6KW45_9SPHI|nr:hypothetical protein [Pedobacter africanus]MDR6783462.1 hypothetical protein [Pedobacter africanus]